MLSLMNQITGDGARKNEKLLVYFLTMIMMITVMTPILKMAKMMIKLLHKVRINKLPHQHHRIQVEAEVHGER